MTSAREAALEVLVKVARDRAHAAPLLDARARSVPERDHDLLRVLTKTVLRNTLLLDHVLARHASRPLAALEPEVLAALRLGAVQLLLLDRIPPHAAVAESVGLVKARRPRAAGLVNAVLRRVAADEPRPPRVALAPGAGPLDVLAVATSHPLWLVRRWVERFGEGPARAALAADNEDAPVDVLLDPAAGPAGRLRDELGAVASPWAPLAATVRSPAAGRHPLVASGRVAVVDAAAQAMVELVQAAPVVVDLAAAPGGKTRTLLARGKARKVIALEKHPRRALRLARNLASGGRRGDVLVVLADATRPPLRRGAVQSLLLDAPCSGTGTLRKSPEIRGRLKPEDLAPLAAAQAALLDAALDVVGEGGSVVYVTCSLEREENEDVVSAVTARRADCAVERPDRSALPAPLAAGVTPGGAVRVLPGPTGDGFSGCLIRKRPKAG